MKGVILALLVFLFLYEALGTSMTQLSIFVQQEPPYSGLYKLFPWRRKFFDIEALYVSAGARNVL